MVVDNTKGDDPMQDHITRSALATKHLRPQGLLLTASAAVFTGAFLVSACQLFALEPLDVGKQLEEMSRMRVCDWVPDDIERARVNAQARFLAENRDAIITYAEKRVEEVQRPDRSDHDAYRRLSVICSLAVRADRERGLAICLRLLRNFDRALLIVEEFLYGATVNYSEVFGEDGMKFIRLVQDTRSRLLNIFRHYHSSLAVPEAKRYLLVEWPNIRYDALALDYLMARAIDDLEVRAWLEALAKDPTSRLNTKDYLAERWKAYKKW